MKKNILLCLMLLSVLAINTGCVKIIDKGTEAQYRDKVTFNADSSVEQLWTDVVKNIEEHAVDLNALLAESNGKLSSVAEQYGVNGRPNFPIKGEGIVTEIETSKSAGYVILQLDNDVADTEVRIQIGPTFKSKDILGDTQTVTAFGNYTNQTEWGQVKDALVKKVSEKVIAPLDVQSLEGKTVEFTGALGVSPGSTDLLVIPVSLKVK